MADIMSPAARSRVMSRIRSKNTKPERYIACLLDAADLTYSQHDPSLPGRPDFVFLNERVVVFVDGDFWHGWRFPIWKHRLSEFWREKIDNNRQRDRRCHQKLRRLGWDVIRVWEHQIETDVLNCIDRIVHALNARHIDWQSIERAYREMPPLKRRKRLPKP